MKPLLLAILLAPSLSFANGNMLGIRQDRWTHFGIGWAMADLGSATILREERKAPFVRRTVEAVLILGVIGVFKEMADGKPDMRDMQAGCLGALGWSISIELAGKKPRKKKAVVSRGH